MPELALASVFALLEDSYPPLRRSERVWRPVVDTFRTLVVCPPPAELRLPL